MTPIVSHFLVLGLVVGLTASPAAAQSCGDADGNGSIALADGVNVLRSAAGLSSTCSADETRCDLDGNGSVGVSDGVNVLRVVAGLSAALSCPNAGASVERFAGRYQGTFSGDDEGDFDVEVGCDGDIEGVGYSSVYDEDFDVMGAVTREGDATFTAGTTDSFSRFRGTVRDDGDVSGTWSNDFEDTSGDFRGSRTSQRGCE